MCIRDSDDTAYDALIDLKGSSDIIADMEQYFDEVIQAEYIGYDLSLIHIFCGVPAAHGGVRLCGEAWPGRSDLIPGPWAG